MISKILVVVTFLAMVTINALANILPINGVGTGDVSDAYGNLFAPAALTFSIWGLIYFLLTAYTLYQLGLFQKDMGERRKELFGKIGKFYAITSVANILWIFSWHYGQIGFSVLFMAIILSGLIKIADLLKKEQFSAKEKFFIKIPFGVYFGWITVAAIANITTFLVSIGWNGFGISDHIWTVAVLLIGAAIGVTRMMKDKNIAYGLVLAWAYLGILIKHVSASGFAGQHTDIIATAILSIIIFLGAVGLVFFRKKTALQGVGK
jgi:hypothetical protein